ncbi:carbamoyl phosphate synthase-like protein [Corynebacterium ammoniagenes]|uniref:Carbamoyl phosphate synthase-like protein n=1 Tax=Corynebacterium ammoniagenes TaxID=1697 RepID=A0AAV5G1L1_CORAM|nr:ATP-grasp domain-containing protein [Corynebacterium ammoniagenes]GJN41999.1 carbamoyl phosphate synthase-like protein [Corynebacterium ammoniagenes]
MKWFQDALRANSIDGKVIAADLDPLAPARQFADHFVTAPAVTDPTYRSWLEQTLAEQNVELAVSINDFELSEWAQLEVNTKWQSLVRLDAHVQTKVEDKYAMSECFEQWGIPSPKTWLGKARPQENSQCKEFVTKGRFGSASRGLQFVDPSGLDKAIEVATEEVTDRTGVQALRQDKVPPTELVLVQEKIDGIEYGLDVISDLNGEFVSVLVRRKIAMRGGETDRAESVDACAFQGIARQIAETVPHPGMIDVDVIVDSEGTPYVIDVNPRFGGGYPLSHVAGARVPNAYVAWCAGMPVSEEWFKYELGAVAGKYVEAVRVQ